MLIRQIPLRATGLRLRHAPAGTRIWRPRCVVAVRPGRCLVESTLAFARGGRARARGKD